jgi:hypothetical protein
MIGIQAPNSVTTPCAGSAAAGTSSLATGTSGLAGLTTGSTSVSPGGSAFGC